MQRRMVVSYRRFDTNYQRSSSLRLGMLDSRLGPLGSSRWIRQVVPKRR